MHFHSTTPIICDSSQSEAGNKKPRRVSGSSRAASEDQTLDIMTYDKKKLENTFQPRPGREMANSRASLPACTGSLGRPLLVVFVLRKKKHMSVFLWCKDGQPTVRKLINNTTSRCVVCEDGQAPPPKKNKGVPCERTEHFEATFGCDLFEGWTPKAWWLSF